MDSYQQYNPMMTFITPKSFEKRYAEGHDYDGKTIKWGQLKLLTNEILFFVNHCDTDKYGDNITYVVAGGA